MRNHKTFRFGPWLNKCSVHTCAYQRLISSVSAGRTRALNELAKTSIMGSYTAVFWLITSQRDCQVSETEFWLSNSNLCCSSRTLFQMVLSDLVNCFIQFTTKNNSFTNRTSIWTVCLRHTLQVVIFSFLHRPIVLLHKTIRSNGN